MRTSEKIAFGMLIVFLVFMLSVVAWGHGEGECLTDADRRQCAIG